MRITLVGSRHFGVTTFNMLMKAGRALGTGSQRPLFLDNTAGRSSEIRNNR